MSRCAGWTGTADVAAMGERRAGSAPAPAPAIERPAPRPPTGRQYLDRLRDGRVVYYEGRRVGSVPDHPALANGAGSIARLYDSLHDPAQSEVLTAPTDTGSGGFTHRFFRAARSREDLLGARDAIAHWSKLTYGWMGRSPDYKASLTTTFGAAAAFYGPFEDSARRWYRHAQENVTFLAHALADPPIDRHGSPEASADVRVRIERETDAGIIVSGAKVVATGAATAEYCFVGHTPGFAGEDDAANLFIVPIAAPGVKLICRASYELAARRSTPFDCPLASRFDENDAILILDRVFVPWENVLAHRDPERVRGLFMGTGFLNNFLFHGCTRLAVKTEFLAGLLSRALRATGGMEARGKRALLGEVVALAHTLRSLSTAMASCPDPWQGGTVLPERRAALAYCVLAPDAYPRILEIIQRTIAAGLIYLPSSAADLLSEETAPLLKRFVRGAGGIDHRERIKVMKLLWDACGSEFAGRHELYERSYAGGWECIRLMLLGEAEREGRLAAMEDLVDRCMAEYDECGWTAGPWSAGEGAPPDGPSPSRA